MRLTKRNIDAVSANTIDKVFWDDTLPGFGLRVKPTGTKTFLVQYRTKKASTIYTDKGRIERHIVPLLGHRAVKEISYVDIIITAMQSATSLRKGVAGLATPCVTISARAAA